MPQLDGSNTPQSSIKQLPSITLQQPGQVVTVPAMSNPYEIPKELQEKPGPPYAGRDAYNPTLTDKEPAEQASIGSPRTATGKNANPRPGDDALRKALAAQLKNPIVIPGSATQEKSYTDPSRASPLASPLIQPVPMGHQ